MSTLIVGIIVLAIVGLAAKSVYKQHKEGGCGGSCASCGGHCHDIPHK